ncbi:hypothetical protein CAPTEDRAFT_227897 [Capitella teleta]|uniref:CUB domain-containing protein n=1 Tax=Capitella teleta TaxID=283909 RepID=R7U671_CAPTE|nr:hypothetical protein CAPTEDRAFT_227897 [Capitella teleta]|eukprot:ELU01606.1 hypothetical protein CAPTEDRAFT_227897 [Capitella teleta]
MEHLLVLLCVLPGVISTVQEVSLTAESSYEWTSRGFPSSCCGADNTTLILTYNNYLRIIFSDLDLPRGSRLEIHDGSLSGPLFQEQPEFLSTNVWHRPVIATDTSDSVVTVVFQPNVTDNNEHAGFKIHFINTKDSCPALSSAMEAKPILLKSRFHTDSEARLNDYDCVWHVKLPKECESTQDYFTVYLRITLLDFRGRLEIMENYTSSGKSLLSLNSPYETYSLDSVKSDVNAPWGFVSSKGFFVRLTMPAFGHKYVFQMDIGVYSTKQYIYTGESCRSIPGLDFLPCAEGKYCFPSIHKCNQINNCPSGSDEICPVSTTTTTTTVPTTTTTRRTTTPSGYLPKFEAQSMDKRSSRCYSFQKRCEDGSCVSTYDSCPEDSCPNYGDTKCNDRSDCYSESDRCDDYNDCSDGDSEYSEEVPWWPFIIGFLSLASCCGCCYYCCCHKSKTETATNGTTVVTATPDPTPVNRFTNLESAGRDEATARDQLLNTSQPHATAGVYPTRSQPTAPPATDTELSAFASGPPTYDEALSNSTYDVNQSPDPPPPSYDSVRNILPSAPPYA